jgi:SnoaL-like domain
MAHFEPDSATQNADGTVAALVAEVLRLRDHEDIRQLLYRYARGVDCADLDLLCSVYHPDGTDHHGNFDGPGEVYARRLVDAEADLAATGNHHITNIFIQLDGDEARVSYDLFDR